MRKIMFIRSTIFYLIWICLITQSAIAADSNLLFKSGFEEDSEIVLWTKVYTNKHSIEGFDGGFSWPDDLPGDGNYSHFVYLVEHGKDISEFIQTDIATVIGRDGKSTRALYQAVKKDDPDDSELTRNQYNMYPSATNKFDQLYVRYWIKLQSNLDIIMPSPSWRMLTEWYESGEDYRFNLMVTRPWNGGDLKWTLKGVILKPEKIDDFLEFNEQIPVPVGEWFLLELFWKHSSGPDGQILVKVNRQEVFNRTGRNKLDSEILAFSVFKCYGRTDYYQWIDDFEVWDNIPEIKTPQPPSNIRFMKISQ